MREWREYEHSPVNIEHWPLGIGRVGIEFHIPIEIVTPAVRRIPNPDGNCDHGIPAWLHRFFHQLHTGFFRRTTALLVITAPARRHDIFPGLSSPLGDGDDVIECEFLGSELMAAVLACVAISRKDIDARKFDCPMDVFEPNQLKEAHHRGELDGNRDRVDLSIIDFEDFDFTLPEERNRLLPMDDPQGFVRRVEQKGHFHTATSSQPRLLL